MPGESCVGTEYCRVCGKPESEVGKLSTRGKCLGCAASNIEQAHTQLTQRSGPIHDKWAANVVAGVTRAA